MFAFVSAPADTFANTFPSLALHVPTRVRKGTPPFLCPFPNTFLPLSLSKHIPSFVPFRTHSFLEHILSLVHRTSHTRSQTHTPLSHYHPHDAALHPAPRGPRARPPVGWVGRAYSRAISTPCDLPVTAWSTTDLTTRPRRPSKTPLAAASASSSSKRPRCATPLPGVPTPDSLDSPDSPPTASPTSPSSDSVRASLTASPTPRLPSALAQTSPPAPRPPRPRSRASRGGALRRAGARS